MLGVDAALAAAEPCLGAACLDFRKNGAHRLFPPHAQPFSGCLSAAIVAGFLVFAIAGKMPKKNH
jgi:hypothetical protein